MSDYDNIVPAQAYNHNQNDHITDEKDEKYGGGDVSSFVVYNGRSLIRGQRSM
jgi:hypothetical protein